MLKFGEFKVYIETDFSTRLDFLKFHFFKDTGDGREILGSDGLIHSVRRGEPIPKDYKPFLLPQESLQALVNAIADFGIVPEKAKLSEDELKAVRYHLEDLRTLLFSKHKLNIKKENKQNE